MSAVRRGRGYWALAEMVKAHAGILETDDGEAALASCADAVAILVPTQRTRPGSSGSCARSPGFRRRTAPAEQEEAFAAWRRFLEALAEDGPAVLVLEDLHWADDGLLDFVDHLADWATGVPLLVVCVARPELLEPPPGWGGGKPNATTLSLAPLTDDEIARSSAPCSTARSCRPTCRRRCSREPAATRSTPRSSSAGSSERGLDADRALPSSVQGIIAARLDDLDPAEKALLQDAAVIGKVFWLGGVARSPAGVDGRRARLHELERRQIVRPERRSSVAGEVEYAFWHVLVRDVAYGQIPRRSAPNKHRLAAEWIDSLSRTGSRTAPSCSPTTT